MKYEQAVKAFGEIVFNAIECAGMQAENRLCQQTGASLSYGEDHFYQISAKVKKIVEGLK